jgi:hypothetical protein
VADAHDDHLHQSLERLVDVDRQAEAAARLQRDEAVEGAAQRPHRVDDVGFADA